MTTTRGAAARAEGMDVAPAPRARLPADTRLRNSRLERLMVVFILEGGRLLLLREPGGDRVELLVGVALRVLVHHGRLALAVPKLLHQSDHALPVQAGDGRDAARAHAVGAVTAGAVSRQA